MSNFDIITPDLPESVADATVVKWHKNAGESVKHDEILVEIETDKVVLEVPAVTDGVLETVLQPEGATVISKQLLGKLSTVTTAETEVKEVHTQELTPAERHNANLTYDGVNENLSPGIRRLIAEHDLDVTKIKGSGVGGRITREDVERFITQNSQPESAVENLAEISSATIATYRTEQRVPRTRVR